MSTSLAGQIVVYEQNHRIDEANFADVLPYDRLSFDGQEADIKAVRQTIAQFQNSPTGEIRLLIIHNADELSELLQNTLLKIIEEPPPKGAVVIQAKSVDALLPTIRSRITHTRRSHTSKTPVKIDLTKLYSLKRQEGIFQLESYLQSITPSNPESVRQHQLLNQTIIRIKQNLNYKLALDWLLLNWGAELGKE